MPWYEIIIAHSESFSADRAAEDLLRQLVMALQPRRPGGSGGVLWSDRAGRAPLLFSPHPRPLPSRNGC